MKKRFFRALSFSLSLAVAFALAAGLALPGQAATGPAGITSQAYVVMDADTGQVLLAQNAEEELDPASVTKIMTVGLACAIAQGDWSAQLTVSHDDVHSLWGTDSSHIALQEGEVVSLQDLLYAAAIASANDACNVLAEYIGGSIDGGVAAMNAQAAALGLAHTHFANPHGISEEGHYISAGDLAVILRWALQQPGFTDLFSRDEVYYMSPTNLQSETRGFWLQDAMRNGGSRYYIPEIVGSKIGYTNEARYTYACLAEKDGVRLICTVMKSNLKTEKYADVASLLSYSFSRFRRVEIAPQAGAATVTVAGGGAALGQLPADAPGVALLLDSSLDESAVSFSAGAAEYLLGGALPTGTYTVSGQGVQEDAALTVSLALNGLPELLAQYDGVLLDTAGDAAPADAAARRVQAMAWLAVPLAAACGWLLWRSLRRTEAQAAPNRKKRLQKRTK